MTPEPWREIQRICTAILDDLEEGEPLDTEKANRIVRIAIEQVELSKL